MRVALVHDYIREFGGAERVLKVLTEMYPKAPIYTAFRVSGSSADKEFDGKEIHESFLSPLLKIWKLYSPLRFLTPLIWGSMDLSSYDLVITSSSWYITRGFKVSDKTKVVCYCHTPPRWLYGYETSVGFTKYWPVKVYAFIVGYFMRKYDYATAQEPNRNTKYEIRNTKITAGVDYFIANSKNVQARIKKFYGRESVVIYPPVDTKKISAISHLPLAIKEKVNYFLVVSRLVGAKGLEEIVNTFRGLQYKLKVVGEAAGYSNVEGEIRDTRYENIEFLGRVSDEELYKLYAGAKALICLARDEDFGMTPVEAMAAGTPVIAFNGGGYKESVVDPSAGSGQVPTGILVNRTDKESLSMAIKKSTKIKWNKNKIVAQASKFSKESFVLKLKKYIGDII